MGHFTFDINAILCKSMFNDYCRVSLIYSCIALRHQYGRLSLFNGTINLAADSTDCSRWTLENLSVSEQYCLIRLLPANQKAEWQVIDIPGMHLFSVWHNQLNSESHNAGPLAKAVAMVVKRPYHLEETSVDFATALSDGFLIILFHHFPCVYTFVS